MSEENKETKDAKQVFMDFLAGEGFRPELDKDSDIHFKYEGKHYYILLSDKDRQFVRILYPQFWEIESEEERQKALEAAQYATRRCKVCKVYTDGDNVSASIEMFAADPAHTTAVLPRMIGALQSGANRFIEEMRKETSEA